MCREPITVRLDNTEIVFGDEIYYITCSTCRTWEDIVGWSLQLSEKTWCTTEIIRRFILLALKMNALKRPILG